MKTSTSFKEEDISALKKMVLMNAAVDFKNIAIQDGVVLSALKWPEDAGNRTKMILVLKAYQRLLRIIPGSRRRLAFELLKLNFHSAVQIASLSKREFVDQTETVFKKYPALVEGIYNNAVAKRGQVVVQYMDILQNNEPHVKAARV